jgi:hypothetical protein
MRSGFITSINEQIEMIMENVLPEYHNAFIIARSQILVPFDYDSIMIYGNYAFSISDFEDKPTLIAKNNQPLLEAYEKKALTKYDVQNIRVLYECDDKVNH